MSVGARTQALRRRGVPECHICEGCGHHRSYHGIYCTKVFCACMHFLALNGAKQPDPPRPRHTTLSTPSKHVPAAPTTPIKKGA